MKIWHLLQNRSASFVDGVAWSRKKILLAQKTGQFEYQKQQTIDIICALLTFQPKKSEACEASSDSLSHTVKITLYTHIQSPTLI